MITKRTHTQGFTILYAVLISSVMLAIGIAIFNITVRELRLSSVVRESQKAIYAADSGAECGLYNAFRMDRFSTSSPQTFSCSDQTFPLPSATRPSTDTAQIGGYGYSDSSNSATSTFTVTYGATCAVVSISQHLLPGNQIRTIIESRGYNPCTFGPTRVERVYRVLY